MLSAAEKSIYRHIYCISKLLMPKQFRTFWPVDLSKKKVWAVHRAKKSTLLLMSFTYQIHNWQTEITQGPLKIWNTQISHYKVGGTQKPFTETQLFFAKKMWKHFPRRRVRSNLTFLIKFDIFHILAESKVNSVICFFWALLQAAKIWNSWENAHVRAA